MGAPYNYQKVVPTFIVNALQDKPLPIFGDGEQRADYIFIDDAAEAFLKALHSSDAVGRVIPIGNGDTVSVNELADLIIKLTGSRSHKRYSFMRKGESPLSIYIDTSMAKGLFNFKAKVSLEEGLKRTIPYYREKLALEEEKREVLA